jgi:hypothetical protein
MVKAVADVNGDGFADVIFQSQSTGAAIFADMANGAFSGWGVVAQNINSTFVVVGVADVDNDGHTDVIFQHTTDGQTLYAHMGPNGFLGWGAVGPNLGAAWDAI